LPRLGTAQLKLASSFNLFTWIPYHMMLIVDAKNTVWEIAELCSLYEF